MNPFADLLNIYEQTLTSWQTSSLPVAQNIFLLLAAIQIIWSGTLWLWGGNTGTLSALFLRRMMYIGFFWMVLTHYPVWIPTITESLQQSGQHIAGTLAPPSAVNIAEKAIALAYTCIVKANSTSSFMTHFESLLVTTFAAAIFFALIRIALELTLLLIGGKIILAGGIIILGGAACKWTMPYAERYISTAISLGIRTLFITAIVTLGETVSAGWRDFIMNSERTELVRHYIMVVAGALLYYYLAIKVPQLAAQLLTSHHPFTPIATTQHHG